MIVNFVPYDAVNNTNQQIRMTNNSTNAASSLAPSSSSILPSTTSDYMVFDGTKTIRYDHSDAFQTLAPYTIELDVYLESGSNKVIATNGDGFGLGYGEWAIVQEATSVIFYSSENNAAYQINQTLIPNYMTKRWYRINVSFYVDSGDYYVRGTVNRAEVFDVRCEPPYNTTNGLSFGADWAYTSSSSPAGSLSRRFVGRLRNIYLSSLLEPFNPPVWNIQTGNLGAVEERTPLTLPLSVIDPENNVEKFEIISGSLPPGLTLNKGTGVISGTVGNVSQDTIYYFTVKVTDRTRLTLTGSFSIAVVNSSSMVTWNTSNTTDLASVAPGEPANIQLNASTDSTNT